MRRTLRALLAVVVTAVLLSTATPCHAKRRDRLQKDLVYWTTAAADVYTTKRTVIDHPDRFHELNPVLGRHPDLPELVALKLGGYLVLRWLDHRYRLPKWTWHIVGGVQLGAALHNRDAARR